MKKILKFLPILLIAVLGIGLASCDNDKDEPVSPSQLPANATEFINQFYPSTKVVSSYKDKNEYDVVLSDGTEIEFDKDGYWKDVDAPAGKSIATGFYPSVIDEYVAENFSKDGINEITKVKKGFEVELISTTEILFDPDGSYIGIDIDR